MTWRRTAVYRCRRRIADFTDDPMWNRLQSRVAERGGTTSSSSARLAGLVDRGGLREAAASNPFASIEQGGDSAAPGTGIATPAFDAISSPLLHAAPEEVATVPSERYPEGAEIFAHCQAIGGHYDLYGAPCSRPRTPGSPGTDITARWTIESDRGDTIRARFVTGGPGTAAKVKLPSIPHPRFQGPHLPFEPLGLWITGGDAASRMTNSPTSASP